MTITVIDNFLEEEKFKKIQETLLSGWFPWYFTNGVADLDETNSRLYDFQFTHTFFRDGDTSSNWFPLLDPVIEKLRPAGLVKMKANLLTVSENTTVFDYHIDMPEYVAGKTAILYINTNNGFTIFKDGTKISSIANRLVVFDSTIVHTGTTCSDQKTRCVLNINFVDQ